MTIADVARAENVTVRQAQRYCRAPGYKGHVLKATKLPTGFVIELEDYRCWRLECGFDFLPQAPTVVAKKCADCGTMVTNVSVPESGPHIESSSNFDEHPTSEPSSNFDEHLTFAELQRRYFSPDRVGGPPTNTFAVGSGTMCSPATQRAYMKACAERMKLRGYENDEDE